MKTILFVLVIILLFAVTISFAEDKIRIEDTYGTWVNPDYNVRDPAEVIICKPDSTLIGYSKATDIDIDWTLQYTITDSWYDDEGNLFVKYEGALNWAQQSSHLYFLNKFGNDGTVWEMVWSGVDYPTEVSLIGGNYSIRYRQE
jgi:hypothetical protein